MSKGLRNTHKERERFFFFKLFLSTWETHTESRTDFWKIVEQNEVFPWASLLPTTVFSVAQEEPHCSSSPVHLKLLPCNKSVCTFQNEREEMISMFCSKV